MANKALVNRDSLFATMILQLNNQSAQQVIMQQELQAIKQKLDQASKTLAQKDQIIGSLEQDLEHMIDQLNKIQHNRAQAAESQWLNRGVPGINIEVNATAVA